MAIDNVKKNPVQNERSRADEASMALWELTKDTDPH